MKRSKIGIVPVIKRSNPDQDAVPLAKAPCAGGDSFGGDGSITDDAESIRSLMNMSFDIKC